jgi:hypothetical protein
MKSIILLCLVIIATVSSAHLPPLYLTAPQEGNIYSVDEQGNGVYEMIHIVLEILSKNTEKIQCYMSSHSLGNATVILCCQHALSYLASNDDSIFWVSGYNIMTSTIGVWCPSLFAKTTATGAIPISALSATNNTVLWAIGNIIYSQQIGTNAQNAVTKQEGVINSVAYDDVMNLIVFTNSSSNVNYFIYGTTR